MKRLSLYILSSLLLITAGCKEDYNQLATGYGDLGITLSIDTTITNIALAQPIKIDAPDINSISISAKGENGNLREWKNIEEFEQTHKMIPVDNYTFQASSGQTDAEGYVTPVFAAECKAYVNDNSLTEISLDCKVASTIITSTKRINNQIIKDLSIRVKSDNGKYVALSRNDMAAMINPGKIRGEVTITDNSGREVTIQPIEIENAEHSPVERTQQYKDVRQQIKKYHTTLLAHSLCVRGAFMHRHTAHLMTCGSAEYIPRNKVTRDRPIKKLPACAAGSSNSGITSYRSCSFCP